ncbi:MAG: hypothetical protein AAF645_28530, partial [Myxococcota bacterium]
MNLKATLVDGGLVTPREFQLAAAEGGCLVANLVMHGADGDAILRVFEEQFGPAVGPVALAGASYALTSRVPLAMAEAFYALPVAETAEFVVMAMANPDDSHAITELERLLGASVEPRPARVSELKQALLRLRSTAPAEPEPIPLRAAAKAPQRQAAPAEPTPLATRASERDDPPSGTVALPLLRTKPADRTFARPSEDSWDATPIETPISSARPGDIGPVLAALRQAESRDHAVALACRGVTRIARLGVLLGLRRGVLRGWDGFGDGISQDAIRNLWIPTSSPSMFR